MLKLRVREKALSGVISRSEKLKTKTNIFGKKFYKSVTIIVYSFGKVLLKNTRSQGFAETILSELF
ncbi:MAG: hypothetical protein ACTSVA_06110 [Candidatus Njordarchaeales archaeon]